MFLRILRAPCLRSLVATTSVATFAFTAFAPSVCARPKAARQKTVSKRARVLVETAHLRVGPSPRQKTVALLNSGDSAHVVSYSRGWLRLRTPGGAQGWVRDDLLRVNRYTVVRPARRAPQAKRKTVVKKPSRPAVTFVRAPVERARFVRAVTLRPVPKAAAPHIERIAVAAPEPAAIRAATVTPAVPAAEVTGLPAEPAGQRVQVAMATFTPPVLPPAVPSRTERLVRTALSYRGTPYRMGARGRGAFDCSGFTSFLFAKAGSPLPRTAREQFRNGIKISKEQMQPGDLVFFKNTYRRGVSHVGVYIGNGNFVHASSSGRGVRVDSLNGRYYARHWAGARRKIAP